MAYNYAPRISMDYESTKDAIAKWAERCAKIIVYAHEPDSGCNRPHIHIYIEGVSIKEEQLKRMWKASVSHNVEGGNKYWSWEHKKWKEAHPNQDYNDTMITYMSKGELRPVFVKGFPAELVEERRQQWIKPTPKSVKPSHESSMLDDAEEAFWKTHKIEDIERIQLDAIRSWVMSWYFRKMGKLPQVSAYKVTAGSLYLRIIDKLEAQRNVRSFSSALEEIKELWY